MRKLYVGVLLTALATLVLELMLIRAFDVILVPNLAYFVVTTAVFGFGLAGIYSTLRPLAPERDIRTTLFVASAACATATILLIPLLNALPLEYRRIARAPITTVLTFGVLDLALLIPFFLAGYVLISVFTTRAQQIQRLYFWDLAGAGLGTVVVIPLISRIGPGGLIVCASALLFFAAALFSPSRRWSTLCALLGVALIALPLLRAPNYIDFRYHTDKRGVRQALAEGRGEQVRWDPISKINVVDQTWTPAMALRGQASGDRKAIEYDGGNQTSYFYKFDGNLPALRAELDRDKSRVNEQFWQLAVLASHYLKRDSGSRVLVLGSAGGQETKAALTYGASHVDAVELVPTVVALGTGLYAPYIGNIFANPAVHVQAGEGRSFLRSSNSTYDIIQIYSNHTSSSIAQGNGALAPVYLQTAEAYQEYFSHLAPDGVLQINHYVYPRMITTAALAWKRMGRKDFARHVAVFSTPALSSLPTLLIRMQPWTQAQIDALSRFLSPPEVPLDQRSTLQENPLDPRRTFLSSDFYSGDFPDSLAARLPLDYTPRTDDNPYFSFMRKKLAVLAPAAADFVDPGSAYYLNASLIRGIPMDLIHLFLTGIASAFLVVVFIFVPLRFSQVGREQRATAVPLLAYFSCLGAGFITLELVLVQKFMHVIGSPLYTYSTVIFSMLFAAGIGSAASEKLGIGARRRWVLPFVGVLASGALLVGIYPWLSHAALALPVAGRVLVSGLAIVPLGFFLGMPFPLGILAIEQQSRGAVAWAWGMNGLFTAIGGLLSVVASTQFGFNATILFALFLYVVALAVFMPMRDRYVLRDVKTAAALRATPEPAGRETSRNSDIRLA
jgi:spermidine synthase